MGDLTNNFSIHEFVPPETIEYLSKLGLKGSFVIDNRLPEIMEKVRSYFGNKPITINDWNSGGSYSYRGFRPSNVIVGAQYSQHRFGRAIDFEVSGLTSFEVQENIMKHRQYFFDMGVKRVEYGTNGWTHIDIGDMGLKELFVIDVRKLN